MSHRAPPDATRDQVFICYSRKDKDICERFCIHLKPLEERGLKGFVDVRTKAGDKWEKEIAQAVGRTRVAVLLVTADFFDSEYIQRKELSAFLDASDRGELTLAVVHVGSSSYRLTRRAAS